MVLLCSLTLATQVASVLRTCAKTEAELHDIAESVEVIKEILTQISVNPDYTEQAAAATFCHRCLYTLRALLLDWPKTENNSVWSVAHPSHNMFLTEIQSSLRFLSLHSKAFEGEPWLWLVNFLETLEFHLAL